MNQELRQAAVLAEKDERLCEFYEKKAPPSIGLFATPASYWKAMHDYREAEAHELSEALIRARAALSALSAVLEAPTDEARSGSGVPARPTVEPCPRGDDKPEVTCANRHQCWEPCGELGNSAEHVRVVRACPVDFAEKQTGYKRCPKHPRYVTTPFCPDCLREAEAALAASPLPQARMLTEDEVMHSYNVPQRDGEVYPRWMDRMNAAIRKFCEVNGIAIAATQGEQKP